MAPSRDAAILAKMAAALKAESETALGGHAIICAAVTAPWMAAWGGQIASDSIINDVLVLVGIEPVTWEGTDPIYLGESNSLLATNKRRLCQDRWCCGDLGPSEQGAIAFLIRYVNLTPILYTDVYIYPKQLYETFSPYVVPACALLLFQLMGQPPQYY